MRYVLAILLAVLPLHAEQIACTETALHDKIAALNANCSGDKEITFNCSNTTIYINDELRKYCDDGTYNSAECVTDQDCYDQDDDPPCSVNEDACQGSGSGCTGANTPYQCCTGNGTGTCCSGCDDCRIITCDGVTIDGESNNITQQSSDPRLGGITLT